MLAAVLAATARNDHPVAHRYGWGFQKVMVMTWLGEARGLGSASERCRPVAMFWWPGLFGAWRGTLPVRSSAL